MNVSQAAKPRPHSELIMHLIQPVANYGVRLLAQWNVNPLMVVVSHAICGFLAAFFIAQGAFVAAAVLLQIKTLLDNMDGGLARVTQQITEMGRYLDTGLDFLVNISLFVVLSAYGSVWLSLPAFLLLTLILSFDFNAERLYKLERSLLVEQSAPIGAPMPLYRLFKNLYDWILAPQDKLIAQLDAWRFRRLSAQDYASASQPDRLAWADLFSTASLVNLGLSTQLFMLGICLLLGQPFWYVYLVYLQAVYLLCVQLLRGWRFRQYLRS